MNRHRGNCPREGHDGVENQSRFYSARAVGHDTHALTRPAQALCSYLGLAGYPDPANIKQRHPMFTGVALLEVLRI